MELIPLEFEILLLTLSVAEWFNNGPVSTSRFIWFHFIQCLCRFGKGKGQESGSWGTVMAFLCNSSLLYYVNYGLFLVRLKRAGHCAGNNISLFRVVDKLVFSHLSWTLPLVMGRWMVFIDLMAVIFNCEWSTFLSFGLALIWGSSLREA